MKEGWGKWKTGFEDGLRGINGMGLRAAWV